MEVEARIDIPFPNHANRRGRRRVNEGVDITDITQFTPTNTMRTPARVAILVCALAGGAPAQNPEIVSDGNNVQLLAPSGDITVRRAPMSLDGEYDAQHAVRRGKVLCVDARLSEPCM